MRLQFSSMKVGPFKAFREPQTLRFSKFGPGVHFVHGENLVEPRLGSNGSAKSTLWDAMCWCLYGKTVQGLQGPDVKPWGEPHAKVVLRFFVDDEKHILVRKVGPNRLTLNGGETNQETINRTVGLDYHTFLNTVLFGQGQPFFIDLKPREKMELLSTVLQLDRWEVMADKAADKVKTIEAQRSALEIELQAALYAQSSAEKSLQDSQERRDNWESDRQSQIKAAEHSLRSANKILEEAKRAEGKADLAVDSAETEVRALDREFIKRRDELNAAENSVIIEDDKYEVLEQTQEQLEKELGELGAGDRCSKCGQLLKGTALEKHRSELKAELVELRKKIKANSIVVDKIGKTIKQARRQFRVVREQMESFRSKSEEARDTLLIKQREAMQCVETVQTLKRNLERLETENNPFIEMTRGYKKALRKARDQIEECETLLAKKAKFLERVRYWVKGFKDVRLFLLQEFLEDLEIASNSVIEDMGLVGWSIKYGIERETKSGAISSGLNIEIFKPRSDVPFRWESYSGGESQRLRLVVGLSLAESLLRHAGVFCDMEVLDEPTAHLSVRGTRDLCDTLAERAAQLGRQTWFVDHTVIESAKFQSRVSVVRRKTGAEIVL